MARRRQPADKGFVTFDILYQDGSRTSNRRVPVSEATGPDAEGRIRAFIEGQDREIALLSGNPRGPIKTVTRAA